MHNNNLIFPLSFLQLPRKLKDLWKRYTDKKMCLIFIYNVSLNLHGGTSSIFTSHAHHMQQNNDYTCSVNTTVLQYKGFRDDVVICTLLCRNQNGLHVYLTNSALRHST